jgi:hypothetical protein
VYSLIRALPLRRLVLEQGPALALSLVIAEMFYKFHSFLLETGAFLVTWLVLDFVIQTCLRVAQRRATSQAN